MRRARPGEDDETKPNQDAYPGYMPDDDDDEMNRYKRDKSRCIKKWYADERERIIFKMPPKEESRG